MLSDQFSIFHTRTGMPAGTRVEGDVKTGELTTYRGEGQGVTAFYHADKKGGLDSEVEVHHMPAQSYTRMPPAAMTRPGSDTDGWSDAEYPTNIPGEVPGQMRAFYHMSSRASSTVHSMGATRGGRLSALTSLGMAAQQAQNMGRGLNPSNNLSPHSERLVGKLADSGHTEMPTDRLSNSSDFWPRTESPVPDTAQPVTTEMVEGGRRAIRSVVSRNRKPGGTQDTLF